MSVPSTARIPAVSAAVTMPMAAVREAADRHCAETYGTGSERDEIKIHTDRYNVALAPDRPTSSPGDLD